MQVTSLANTNQLVLIGKVEEVLRAQDFIAELDVDLGLRTEVYQLNYVQPERVDQLMQAQLPENISGRLYIATA